MKKCFNIQMLLLLLSTFFVASCTVDDPVNLTNPTVNPQATPYQFVRPIGFPQPIIPADNPITVEGVELGRFLFYDPILSGDSSMSCGGCHKQEFAFGTNLATETGIRGLKGHRSTMALFNLAWVNSGFFWDGRAKTLEKQILGPVEDPLEMDLSWPEAVKRLQRHPTYPEMFYKAFGTHTVNPDLTTKAIAQFLRTIISANSKFDQVRLGEAQFTQSEMNGNILFNRDPRWDGFGTRVDAGADCNHCHGNIFFMPTDRPFRNNGLDVAKSIYDFKDRGVGGGDSTNWGLFKAPSLRNIALTAPYMHDGRFQTLEEVVEHYNNGGHASPTLDRDMPARKHARYGGKLQLTEQEKKDLIAFLHTLTDNDLITNKAFSNPFE